MSARHPAEVYIECDPEYISNPAPFGNRLTLPCVELQPLKLKRHCASGHLVLNLLLTGSLYSQGIRIVVTTFALSAHLLCSTL